jgi:hypothetical protein
MKKTRISEHAEQANFVSYVLWKYSSDPTFVRRLFFSTFNGAWLAGGQRTRFALINKAKQEGFLPGVADILYLQPRGDCPYLVIEMKAKGGHLSEDQALFLKDAEEAGAMTQVCFGAQDAIDIFDAYMNLIPRKGNSNE